MATETSTTSTKIQYTLLEAAFAEKKRKRAECKEELYDIIIVLRKLVKAGNNLKSEIQEHSAKYGCGFPCVLIDDWDKAIAAAEALK